MSDTTKPAAERDQNAKPRLRRPSVDRVPAKSDQPATPERVSPWRSRRFWLFLALALTANWLLSSLFLTTATYTKVPYSVFSDQVTAAQVAEVTTQGETIQGTFATPIPDPADATKTITNFETERPTFAQDDLLAALQNQHAVINAKAISTGPGLLSELLVGFGPTLLLVGAFIWLSKRTSSMMGSLGGFGGIGKSKAKRADLTTTNTTFADIAGIDDAEDQLIEVVDYLRNPERYHRLGADIPRGVLLTGPPGTGKTLLARAVAGEAGVPFFSVAASEFIEMIVGVGASRTRDLFAQAKAAAPAIVFIDELDAIGRSRAASLNIGGHDEQDQTLNQLLTELDGFDGTEGVIVIGATNRPEVLDAALLRAGRFDRRVTVNPPDALGRAAILAVHVRHVPLDDDVDLDVIASLTPGMVGADLHSLVNEAALLATRRNHDTVAHRDLVDALDRIVLGSERRIVLDEAERRRTAYHEAGHALLGMLMPGADPVRKISIIPRGQALGVTYQSPETDRYGYGEAWLQGRIVGMLGGRAAELVVFGEPSSGAESDLDVVSSLARTMVGRWGMSERIGPLAVLPAHADLRAFDASGFGPDTIRLVDEETRRIVGDCFDRAKEILGEHRTQLDAVATALLERETLDETAAYAIAGIPHTLADHRHNGAHPVEAPPSSTISEGEQPKSG